MQTLKLNRKAEPCSYLEKMISSLATLMSEPLAKKPVRVANWVKFLFFARSAKKNWTVHQLSSKNEEKLLWLTVNLGVLGTKWGYGGVNWGDIYLMKDSIEQLRGHGHEGMNWGNWRIQLRGNEGMNWWNELRAVREWIEGMWRSKLRKWIWGVNWGNELEESEVMWGELRERDLWGNVTCEGMDCGNGLREWIGGIWGNVREWIEGMPNVREWIDGLWGLREWIEGLWGNELRE